MTKSLIALVLFAGTLTASAAEKLIAREHMSFARGGQPGVMTELIAGGEGDSIYTLFQARNGERLVYMYSTNDATKTTTVSITDPQSGEFIRGSFTLKESLAAAPPSAYDVPFSVTTRSFHATASQELWHGANGAKTRAALADHLSPAFVQRVLRHSEALSSAGSPAGRVACDVLASLLGDKPACRRDKAIVVQPLNQDCAFDANFGFPCGPSE